MRKRTLVVAAVAAVSVIAPVSDALRIAPLATRDGVVVTWRSKNKVAVVAEPNGRLRAIHSLRKVTPGARVRVQGIKWGTPLQGIKWSAPARGIKWGIKWGRNGSYQSGLRKTSIRKAVWTPVRGPIVKKIGKKAIAVGTPGGVVVLRIAPTPRLGRVANAVDTLPPVGATISARVFFGKKGARIGRDLKYLKPPVPGASLPFAGAIVSIDPVAKTMVIGDAQDPAYPIRITVQLPPEFTLGSFAPGQEVAGAGQLASKGTLKLTLIGPNGAFSEADDPTAVQILTTGQPACTKAVEAACPPNPTTSTGGDTAPAPAPGGDASRPFSPSTPPTPPPPVVDPPPPPPVVDPPPPPPDCDDWKGHGAMTPPHARRGPVRCVPRPCASNSQRRRLHHRPHKPCRPNRDAQRRTVTSPDIDRPLNRHVQTP